MFSDVCATKPHVLHGQIEIKFSNTGVVRGRKREGKGQPCPWILACWKIFSEFFFQKWQIWGWEFAHNHAATRLDSGATASRTHELLILFSA